MFLIYYLIGLLFPMLKMVTVKDSSLVTPVDPTNGHLEEPSSLSDMHHHNKSPAVNSALRETAMTTEELSEVAFPVEKEPMKSIAEPPPVVFAVSASSSICTRESDTGVLSDLESNKNGMETPLKFRQGHSERSNAQLSLQKTSRQGRDLQRWSIDETTNETVRLVTGCVPILREGKILLISANRKAEWILPKGGWEQDETMEESAARECFEEAGVLGKLGPKLAEIQYETRKSKKRRLDAVSSENQQVKNSGLDTVEAPASDGNEPNTSSLLTNESINKIEEETASVRRPCDETHSIASSYTGNYTQVRMTLFPLYVDTVSSTWPESGRLRKAVDIDEAIELLDSRPEFKAALVEVKNRGLHALPSK